MPMKPMPTLAVRILVLFRKTLRYKSIMSETHTFEIENMHDGLRLDKALTELCVDLSRARIQSLIKDGQIQVNGFIEKSASSKVDRGDEVTIIIPEIVEAAPKAENIALDIVFEDKHLLVINKPIGLVVHPGAGNWDGTLVNALLHHCGDSLSGIGGVARPGIVHRLDKDTSGLMIVAKHDKAHIGLSEQLSDRSLSRVYHALVFGTLMPMSGEIDKPIGRDLKNRQKMAVTAKNSKEAITNYKVLKEYRGALSLVECKLQTGRTHQIRVHMAHKKHPLIGDPLYGGQPTAIRAGLKKAQYDPELIENVINFPRQALHAKSISFIHPISDEFMSFDSDYADDFSNLLNSLD